MKFFLSTIFVLILSFFSLNAQVDSVFYGNRTEGRKQKPKKEPKNDKWRERFTWGGNFQAWVGNPTFVYLSPTVGYIPIKNVNVGIGLIYNYTRIESAYGNFSQSIFGGHSYVRYIIADNYFVQAQFDKLYQPNLLSLYPDEKIWVDYFLVGGGFRQSIGDKAALSTSIMYNLTPDPLSIYPSRLIIQFGIVAGF